MNKIDIKDGYVLQSMAVNPLVSIVTTADSDPAVTVTAKINTARPIDTYEINTIFASRPFWTDSVEFVPSFSIAIALKTYIYSSVSGSSYGTYRNGSDYLTWNPADNSWTLVTSAGSFTADQSATPETVTTLTFKRTTGGMVSTYATATASEKQYCSRKKTGTVTPQPTYATKVIAESSAKGITTVATAPLYLPVGTIIKTDSDGSPTDPSTIITLVTD